MKKKQAAEEPIFDEAPEADLTDLEGASAHPQTKIGTLSFPVPGKPVDKPVYENANVIAEIVKKRQPALLLCAGWTVQTEQSLNPIIAATQQVKTVVVGETTDPPVYFRIADGHAVRMGEQFFFTRKGSNDESLLGGLADALPDRSFTFRQRDALLLNCGEVMVVQGHDHVDVNQSVPPVLRDAVRAPTAMILNPTHTRMKNDGHVKAWRAYLSSDGRVYLSASNWDVSKRQRPSDTLHSLWHDGVAATPTYTFENERLCYREWDMPVSAL